MITHPAPPAHPARTGPRGEPLDGPDVSIAYAINSQATATALVLRQIRKLHAAAGLPMTDEDEQSWILALDLLQDAAREEVRVVR